MKNNVHIENKKAYHDYFVDEKLECGLSLRGNEVKSIREGRCNIKEAWCTVQDGKLVIRGMHIAKWNTANDFDVDEVRERQLLAHKKEIAKLSGTISEKGVTLIPLKVYFNERGKCKLLLGVCRGKHNYDKRESLKERQVKRDIDRAMKACNR